MKRLAWTSLVGALAITGATLSVSAAQAAEGDTARLMVVQAVPGQRIDVLIDGETVGRGTDTGDVLGPFSVPSGPHDVTFRNAAGVVVVETAVDLEAGSSQDLVVHLPAQATGKPVATVYETPTDPIATGKARVLIAHTASVAPADVRLDGTVVFRNIANGEFATADVAQGPHVAELLPSGLTTRPLLGPLDVNLAAATATMVYAVGDAETDSMEVIAHSIPLGANPGRAPARIDAGSAGLAAGIDVTTFGQQGAIESGRPFALPSLAWLLAASPLAAVGASVHRVRRLAAAEASS